MGVTPSLNQLPLHPFELAADVIDNVVRFRALGQHVPGVGLNFEMARDRLFLVQAQRVGNGKTRETEAGPRRIMVLR
jgi:hypothetical protein